MSNIIQTTTQLAMYITSGYIEEGDILVDATCGNGYDTLNLAKKCPAKLYAFDIMDQAILNTRQLLMTNGYQSRLDDGSIQLICDSHENIDFYINQPVKAFTFNLGYLPGGNKNITTSNSSTVIAVKKALNLLDTNGLICITMYSGHDEGKDEKETLLNISASLDSKKYHAAYINMINQKNNPPEILLITKKR